MGPVNGLGIQEGGPSPPLCSSGCIPPKDTSPRRQPPQPTIPPQPVCHRADDLLLNQSAAQQTTSSSTSLPHSRRPPLQPVCRRADDLLYNQSAAERTTSSTTSLQPSCCRRPLLQPVHGCRAIGNQTIEDRRRTAGAPQAYRRRCTTRVAVGDRGRGPARVTISTLNIRCMGELVFIPYIRQPYKKFSYQGGFYVARFALIKYLFPKI